MKIAFIIEYFFPFDKGGSEWSTYYLAKGLVKRGHQVVVITPNYGGQKQQIVDGIKIVRFPFYAKIKQTQPLPGNFFFTNPLWIAWSTFFYLFFLKKENVQIVHIQGKYSILPTRMANIFLNLPIIATVRDYQMICNYGICLNSKQVACSLKEYFVSDFRKYYQIYIQKKNVLSLLLNLLFALRGRFAKNFLKWSTLGLTLVVLSNSQRIIFEKNGFRKIKVIANPHQFPKVKSPAKKEKLVIYAGRLTPGKGVDILIQAVQKLAKEFPDYRFIFIGEGFLKQKILSVKRLRKNIQAPGQIPHENLLAFLAKARVVVVPSVWPEPFGRVALEAIAQNTPVVVSDRGALPEIIDKRWGIVTPLAESDLSQAIKKALAKNDLFTSNIRKDMKLIKRKYQIEPIKKYLVLYEEILK